jgi:hypothetical protein
VHHVGFPILKCCETFVNEPTVYFNTIDASFSYITIINILNQMFFIEKGTLSVLEFGSGILFG